MAEEITFERLQAMAAEAGLNLSGEELQQLLPGVNRSRSQTKQPRELLFDAVEPSCFFAASNKASGKG
jgi:hypothetical protein